MKFVDLGSKITQLANFCGLSKRIDNFDGRQDNISCKGRCSTFCLESGSTSATSRRQGILCLVKVGSMNQSESFNHRTNQACWARLVMFAGASTLGEASASVGDYGNA